MPQTLPPRLAKGDAPVPVIRQVAERLEMHRLRSANPVAGPIFANSVGNPLSLGSTVNRVILPSLNRCETCGKKESDHQKTVHVYKRDSRIPEWHGWHAARRGLGSNLYRLGISDMVIQRILRHANVSTTATYYIKTAAGDVRNAMATLEDHITQAARDKTETMPTSVKELLSEPGLDPVGGLKVNEFCKKQLTTFFGAVTGTRNLPRGPGIWESCRGFGWAS